MNKPKCKLIGEDGNVFIIIGKVRRTLRSHGMKEEMQEYTTKCENAKSYDEVIRISNDYVEII